MLLVGPSTAAALSSLSSVTVANPFYGETFFGGISLAPAFHEGSIFFVLLLFKCFWSLAPQQSIVRDPSVSSPSVLALNHFEWQDLVKSLVSTWTWGNHYFRCATVTLTWKLKLWYEWNPPIIQNNYSNSINEVRQAHRELNYSWYLLVVFVWETDWKIGMCSQYLVAMCSYWSDISLVSVKH